MYAGTAFAYTPKPKAPYTTEAIIAATNAARTEAGLEPLTASTLLTNAAQNKANDMVAKNYFSHTTPTNDRFWAFMDNARYDYLYAGENLAVHFRSTDTLMRTWLTSPSHRENILNAHYTDIGIGLAYGVRKGTFGWYVVQLFGTPPTGT